MGNNARIIGITGATGVGKGVVAELFEKEGYKVVNLDRLAHECLYDQQSVIVSIFGKAILNFTNQINRRALGKLVFNSPFLLAKLEAIIHPLIKDKIEKLIDKGNPQKLVLEGALLHKIQLHYLCDEILLIKSCLLKRVYRLCFKRRLPFFYILKIIKRQKKLVPKNAKNVIIVNNGSVASLKKALQKLKLF